MTANKKKGSASNFIQLSAKLYRLLKNNSFETIKYVASRANFDPLIYEQQFKKNYPLKPDEIGLVCYWGIGDTLMVAGLAHQLIKNQLAKHVVLIVKPSHQYIASCFPAVSKIYLLDMEAGFYDPRLNSLTFPTQQLQPGNYFYAHFKNWEITELLGYKKINILDCYRAIFKLGQNVDLENPIPIEESNCKQVNELFEKYNLVQGKTVLFAPDATSVPSINTGFWSALAAELITKGYQIVLNTSSSPYLVNERAVIIDIPLQLIVPFCLKAGYVVALRSGLCDLLSIYHVNITVIYPHIKWHQGILIDGSGILNMWPSKNLNELEIDLLMDDIAKPDYYKSAIMQIVSTINNILKL